MSSVALCSFHRAIFKETQIVYRRLRSSAYEPTLNESQNRPYRTPILKQFTSMGMN